MINDIDLIIIEPGDDFPVFLFSNESSKTGH